MSDVVGSTPSLTRNGRPSASFSRNSPSLMICAEPCFSDARVSSGCMIPSQNSAPASPGRALLVFVQQLAHLLDRERLVLSVERLLICAFVQKGPVTSICTRGDLFPGLRGVTNAAGGLICVGGLGICKCLLWRNSVGAASAAVGLRIKLRCGEIPCSRIIFRVRFLVNVKRPDACTFVDGHRAVPGKFLVLRIVLQRHVRLEKPIDQFFFLVLSAGATKSSR